MYKATMKMTQKEADQLKHDIYNNLFCYKYSYLVLVFNM